MGHQKEPLLELQLSEVKQEAFQPLKGRLIFLVSFWHSFTCHCSGKLRLNFFGS